MVMLLGRGFSADRVAAEVTRAKMQAGAPFRTLSTRMVSWAMGVGGAFRWG